MKKLIFTVLLFTGALTVAAQEHIEDADAKYAADLLKPGTEAPDFVVDSVKNRSLSYYQGAYVLLDFWASWCPDCRKDIPKVQEIDSLYRDKVAVIGVSFDTSKDAWQQCIKKNKMYWQQFSELKKWKKETEVDRKYRVNWIPTMYLIDPEGKIVLGTVMVEKMKAKLEELDKAGKIKQILFLPTYKGGIQGVLKYLSRHLKYPKKAQKMGVTAKLMMSFWVSEDGSVEDVQADSCTITGCDDANFAKLSLDEQAWLMDQFGVLFENEAKRVVRSMPDWIPAVYIGRKVRVKFHLPISFRF